MPESKANAVAGTASYRGRDSYSEFADLGSALRESVVLLGRDLTIKSANAAFCGAFKLDLDETTGRSLYELQNGQWDIPVVRGLLEDAMADTGEIKSCCLDHEFNNIGRRILMLSARRIGQEEREPLLVLAIYDNTDLVFAKDYSEKIVDALRGSFLVLDWELRVKTANAPFYNNFRVEPRETEGRFIYDLGNGQWDIPRLRELLEEILPKDAALDDFEVEHTFEQIGRRVMILNARRIDHVKLILLTIEDVTEARSAATQQKLVMGELQHRIKNLLTSVRALSHLTLQGASSLEDFAESFRGRLDAIARSQDLLVRGSGGSASLHDIIRLELEAAGATEGRSFQVAGPRLQLSDRASHAFGMTIHELATNAAKYGALSTRAVNGCIHMNWSAKVVERGKVALCFTWTEHGLKTSPKDVGKGFGTQIIETSLPYLFGGSAKVNFSGHGAECRIDVQLPPEEAVMDRTTNA